MTDLGLRERNFSLGVVSRFQKFLTNLLDALSKRTFRVRVDNNKDYTRSFRKLLDQLKAVTKRVEELPKVDEGVLRRAVVVEISQRISDLVSAIQEIPQVDIDGAFQKIADQISPESTKEEIVSALSKLEGVLEKINKKPAPKLEVPKVQKVKGTVSISSAPTPKELKQIEVRLYAIEKALSNLNIEIPPPPKIPAFPRKIDVKKITDVLKQLKSLTQAVEDLPKSIPVAETPEFPDSISVNNFPPQKIPQPVTNININPLRGDFETTAVTVTTSATELPSSAMTNRRSMIMYNNSSSTVYLGGSDVTIDDGLPVPVASFSPPLDAGSKMTVYGIVETGTAEVRILEMSNDAIGG